MQEIFSRDSTEEVLERIHEYLRNLAQEVRENKIPAQKYTIFTKLGKEPGDYPNAGTMPHVQVAIRKRERGDTVKPGDVISYIVTRGPEEILAKRAYPSQDVIKDPNLQPGMVILLKIYTSKVVNRYGQTQNGTSRNRYTHQSNGSVVP